MNRGDWQKEFDRLAAQDPSSQAAKQGGKSLSDLWVPEQGHAPTPKNTDLGDELLAIGAINAAQLTNARTIAAQTPGRTTADIFYDMGISEVTIQGKVAAIAGLAFHRIEDPTLVDPKYLAKLGHDYCKTNNVMPLSMSGSRLLLGVTNPDNLVIIDEVHHRLSVPVKPVVICRDDITNVLTALKEDQDSTVEVDNIIAGIQEDDVEVVRAADADVDLEKMAGESPVIRYVNYLIFNAVKEGASDIHVEPGEKRLRIRYRIDGVLFEMMNPPHHMHAAIISRLKIMANLDISERRLPQDGRIPAMVHGRKLDLRLSTLPTAAGEKAVMRILDSRSIQVTLDNLGMDEDNLLMWKNQIDQPHGILLVTGPTGSGKTTTLYASLAQMDTQQLNISTVEDPVEYHLNGVSQVQAFEKIGMSFAIALRALLRQDPDVIMVGEIRDSETARHRHPGIAHRPPCVFDFAHQRRAQLHHALDQHRRGALPHWRRAERGAGPAPGPQKSAPIAKARSSPARPWPSTCRCRASAATRFGWARAAISAATSATTGAWACMKCCCWMTTCATKWRPAPASPSSGAPAWNGGW